MPSAYLLPCKAPRLLLTRVSSFIVEVGIAQGQNEHMRLVNKKYLPCGVDTVPFGPFLKASGVRAHAAAALADRACAASAGFCL